MSNQETKIYKRSFKGSVGAGVGALFGNTGKSYYILEHKTASKYHKEGETQEIIVNQVEIGRDPSCQIRYDESCLTVSRRHAAIVRDGDGWKLIQLSTTNSTLLNNKEVQKEWYLRNGDEIQLSADGPRLGFIVPAGRQATVGSIGLSRRLSLFRQQAMRPYRNALAIMSICLLAAIVSGGWMIFKQGKDNDERRKESVAYQNTIDSLISAGQKQMEANLKDTDVDLKALIEACKDDVYYIKVSDIYLVRNDGRKKKVFMEYVEETPNGSKIHSDDYAWTGTGFLLDDGRFVTARHCVQDWRYMDLKSSKTILLQGLLDFAAIIDSQGSGKIEADVKAISRKNKTLTFKIEDFKYNNFYDETRVLDPKIYGTFKDGTLRSLINIPRLEKENPQVCSTDWMYVQTNEKGKLTADAVLSTNLQTGTDFYVLGFPKRIGAFDNPNTIEPPFNSFKVASNGLDNSGCILHTRGVDHGNSGGPIFALKDGKLVVIGIVSSSAPSNEYAKAVPISNIYNIAQ